MSAQRLFNKTNVHIVCSQQNKRQVGRRTLPDCRVLTHGGSCGKQSRGKQVNGGGLTRLDVSPGLPLGGKTRGD